MADGILSIYDDFIRPPTPCEGARPGIAGNPKFSPYFDRVDGGVDGTHVPAVVPASEGNKWRNRKGFNSQNVLIYFDHEIMVL